MKMTVTTTTEKQASLQVPHELLVRFVRSLGFPVPADAKLHVLQGSGYGSSSGKDVSIYWNVGKDVQEREVAGMDIEDINVLAGLAEVKE